MLRQHTLQRTTHTLWPVLLGLVVMTLFSSACSGSQTTKVFHIGIISGQDLFINIADGFKAKMAELGYIEGKNVIYDMEKTDDSAAGNQRAADKFVADKVDLIFAFPTNPAVAAKAATQGTNIPVVFANATIEETNLVNSVRDPGGNITGVRLDAPGIEVKRFELLREMAPQVKRVYITYETNYPTTKRTLELLRPAATAEGVSLVEAPIASVADMQADLQARAQAAAIGMDAILIMPEPLSQSAQGWPLINKFATDYKIPLGGSAPFEADQGALFSYIPDNVNIGQLAAPLADKIFKGTPPGTIPVVTPESQLRINYKVAQQLGLTLPEGLLAEATQIIR